MTRHVRGDETDLQASDILATDVLTISASDAPVKVGLQPWDDIGLVEAAQAALTTLHQLQQGRRDWHSARHEHVRALVGDALAAARRVWVFAEHDERSHETGRRVPRERLVRRREVSDEDVHTVS